MDDFYVAMCNSIESTSKVLEEILPLTNSLEYPIFGSLYCMLLEEWCLSHHENITDIIDQISTLIHDVNSEIGPYRKEALFAESEVS